MICYLQLQILICYWVELGPFDFLVTKKYKCWSWSSYCGRQAVDQFVWVSGLPLGPMTRFYCVLFSADNYLIILSNASSLTRKRVCSLQCNHPLWTNNHTLLSHLRLRSLFVASYDTQGLGWRYSNPPPHRFLKTKFLLSHI
jgi:hypothetical protein